MSDKQFWRDMSSIPDSGPILLLLGETIPGRFDVREGERCSAQEALDLGYEEFSDDGGWLIWNSGADFYVIDLHEPIGWVPRPEIAA